MKAPQVQIVSFDQSGDVYRLVAKFDRLDKSGPLAPAGLYTDQNSRDENWQLHKAIAQTGNVVTFETYGLQTKPMPKAGESYFYRGWWVAEAMEAALDKQAKWERRTYPDNGNHDHCLFTWETISAYHGHKVGYWCKEHGWITVKAYEDFIAGDIYHVRGDQGA